MDQPRSRVKKWIWIPVGLLAALLLLLGILYLVGNGGLSARYDDPRAIVAAYDPGAFDGAELHPDGTVTVRLTRDDLYWFANRYGLQNGVRDTLASNAITGGGLRLSNSRAIIYLRTRILGFLPVTCRTVMDVTLDPDGRALLLRTENVHLGRYLPLIEQTWPSLLRSELSVPLGIYADSIRSVRLDADALVLTLDGLQTAPEGALQPEARLLAAIRTFVPESERQADPALRFFTEEERESVPAGEVWALALAEDDPAAVLTGALAMCTDSSVSELINSLDPFLRDILVQYLLGPSREARHLWVETLRADQAQYERVLSSLREMYKSGSLRIDETGFLNAATGEPVHPGNLAELSATATDSRVVFLYSAAGSGELCTEDMPPVTDVPRTGRKVMRDLLDPDTTYDLGAVLTSEGGVPLLLHRRQDGTFILREITETLYVSLLVERSNPVLCVDELPAPAREFTRSAGEGWTGCVLLLLD